ncbi:MAG: NYN domain-containing protein [Cyanobacteria bacterium J06621_11]
MKKVNKKSSSSTDRSINSSTDNSRDAKSKDNSARGDSANEQTQVSEVKTSALDETTVDIEVASETYSSQSNLSQSSKSAKLTASTEKSADKPSPKKSKTKTTSKPASRTTSKRKSAPLSTSTAEPEVLPFIEEDFPNITEDAALGSSESAASSKLSYSEPASKVPTPSPFSLPQSQPSVNQSSDRIAIFIDGSNLFYAASHLNIEVDYRRLLSSLVRGRRLLRAYFYTGVDPQNEKQRGFLLWLNRHGHRVVSKELTHLPDGSRKANMHVEMAVDMMRISEYCPNITLLGGDGNLAYALQVLSQRGIFIEVVSLQSMTSDSLIDLADSYTDLADLRDDIKR